MYLDYLCLLKFSMFNPPTLVGGLSMRSLTKILSMGLECSASCYKQQTLNPVPIAISRTKIQHNSDLILSKKKPHRLLGEVMAFGSQLLCIENIRMFSRVISIYEIN